MIPREVHHIWLQGEDRVPAHLAQFRRDCMLVNRGSAFRVWDGPRIEALLADHDPELLRLYKERPRPLAQLSDIARYVILFVHGGVYVDFDYKCIKPLDALLGNPAIDMFYVPFTDPGGTRLMNGLMGCARGHPMLAGLIAEMRQRLRLRPGASVTYTTGTRLMRDAVRAYHAEHPEDDRYLIVASQQLFPCTVWDDPEKCNAQHAGVSFMTHTNEGSWKRGWFGAIKWAVAYKYAVLVALVALVLAAFAAFNGRALRRCKALVAELRVRS
jgi:mannosyltransferase OCH1-like enzyme